MVSESPLKKLMKTQRDRQSINNYGTPLRLKKQLSPSFVGSPAPKNRTLTFLSPESSSFDKRKTIVSVPRINDSLFEVVNCKISDSYDGKSPEESWYRTVIISPPNSCKRRRPKQRRTRIYDCLSDEELEGKPKPKVLSPSILKRRRIGVSHTTSIYQLLYSYKMIDHWQEQMNRILADNWNYKRDNWIQQCHGLLWNVLKDPTLLEKLNSEIIPKTLHCVNSFSEADLHWYHVLINSARVDQITSPDFSELTYDPQGNKSMDEEFEFQIQFQFGYDVEELGWFIHRAIGKLLKDDLCNIIAMFLGHSKFICSVQIYFKKLVTPWWEQDGIAKMQHIFDGESIDLIDFLPEEEVYFVGKWPTNNLLVDDYNEYIVNTDLQLNHSSGDPHTFLEKKFISAICCQIIHLCMCKTPAPLSCAARNVLKQISMVLNGWFIGVLLGEGLGVTPKKVKFEYDTRASSLTPILDRC